MSNTIFAANKSQQQQKHRNKLGRSGSSSSSSSSDNEKTGRHSTRHKGGLGAAGVGAGTAAGMTSGHHSHETGATGTTEHRKPSLLDKLNPKKDADGDGKAGFMK
jgi:hypothetical protein